MRGSAASPDAARPAYCCAGCAVAAALLPPAGGENAPRLTRSLMLRLGLAAFFAGNAMILSLFLYSLGRDDATPAYALLLVRGLLFVFSLPVFVLLAPAFLRGMMADLRRGRASMDSLIALGAGTAFGYSCFFVWRGAGPLYFDTACMVLLFVTAGRLIEANAHVRGRTALRELAAALVPEARVDRAGAWTMVPSAEVRLGERVRIVAGERIPVDGAVTAGAASVDESTITGEALPAARAPGDSVFAGSLCLDGWLEAECRAACGESLISRIIDAVEQAQLQPAKAQRVADRWAAALTPLTLLLAIGAAAWHWPQGAAHAAWIGLSVLVVACPCALGIAIPLVHATALAAAARRGILIRSGEALERLAEIAVAAFDKTGTLTTGEIEAVRFVPLNGFSELRALEAAALAASCTAHPAARAVRRLAPAAMESPVSAREFPGRGVRVERVGGGSVLLGQPRWVAAESGKPAPTLAFDAGALVCAVDGELAGAFELRDFPAPAAAETVARCRAMGIRVAILSGDRRAAVRRVAGELGIEDARGELLPEEKAGALRELRAAHGPVAMVGDGINDAPALAAADTGIAVSSASALARETAEVVLLSGDVRGVADAFELARWTRRAARINFMCAISYNLVALALAAAGLLQPAWAAALMLLNSVFTVFRACRTPSLPSHHPAPGDP